VLQCGAVCCSVVQCVAVRCNVLQCVAVCRSVLQCVAVSCNVLQCLAQYVVVCCSVLQRVLFLSSEQFVASMTDSPDVYYFPRCPASALQCVAMCGSV
jgi:hypothetical protein